MNIFVGNLSFQASDNELMELFGQYGEVTRASVIRDRDTNRSKGFGFVEMSSDEAANRAIQELNGRNWNGRDLKVNEARPREDRPRRPRY